MAKEETTKSTGKGDTKIITCSCHHDYQDEKYGKGRRLYNPCKDGKAHRCTVCGTERLN